MAPCWLPMPRIRRRASRWYSKASRYEFEGEDKRKIERVAKFYASVRWW